MKKKMAMFALGILLLGLYVPPVFAQASGTVTGVCKDQQGNPIVDGIVVFANQDNGQKYVLKTDKKGKFFSLGVASGSYVVTLYQNADDQQANKELFHYNKYQVTLAENTLDFDLKKLAQEQATGQGLSAEDLKKHQEQQAKYEKEKNTVKALQEHLDTANNAIKAGDFDTAIASLNEANQIDPSRDVLWYKLADAYRLSMAKQTDPAEKQKRLDSAVEDYQKAIQMKQDAIQAGKEKDVAKANQSLGVYYGNLADAYNRGRKVDDAVKFYEMAAKVDPASAAQSYYNIGAVLTNAGRPDEAISAFDKCIAADPTKADAYYQKGVNLIAKETMDKDNKVVAPPGTAEAFQKYLELQPNGPYAEGAKQLLASIGASVETTYGTKKKSSKK